jgi:hypothetical protein
MRIDQQIACALFTAPGALLVEEIDDNERDPSRATA